jgi:hypothetical protein
VLSDRAVHRGPYLVVAAKAKPTPVIEVTGTSVDITVPGKVASSSAARTNLRHHVRVAAELVVREELDRHPALGLGGDRLDRLLQPHVDRVGHGQVVAQLELELLGAGEAGGEGGAGRAGGEEAPAVDRMVHPCLLLACGETHCRLDSAFKPSAPRRPRLDSEFRACLPAPGMRTSPRACGDRMEQILQVTFPFFGLVLFGYVAARMGLLPLEAIPGLNVFVLFFALPAMLYRFAASTPIVRLLDPGICLTYLVCALAMVGFTIATTRGGRIGWNDASFGALVAGVPQFGLHGRAAARRSARPAGRRTRDRGPGDRHGGDVLLVPGPVATRLCRSRRRRCDGRRVAAPHGRQPLALGDRARMPGGGHGLPVVGAPPWAR